MYCEQIYVFNQHITFHNVRHPRGSQFTKNIIIIMPSFKRRESKYFFVRTFTLLSLIKNQEILEILEMS